MRKLIFALPFLCIPACTELEPPGAGPDQSLAAPEPLTLEQQQAITVQYVLNHNKRAMDDVAMYVASRRPQFLALARRQYVAAIKTIDTRPCPADFREAFARYVLAWDQLSTHMDEDESATGVLFGMLSGAAKGQVDLGITGMMAARREKVKAQEDAWGEVTVLAAKYGAIVPE